MQWNVFLLILMGQCSVFTCSMLYKYHFIKETKTWDEAQSYCRENYTDLATVYDMADMKRLTDLANNGKEAWIGLYNKNDSKRTWHWSLPGVEYNETKHMWAEGEPNNKDAPENCVQEERDKAYKWVDVPCCLNNIFICYNETKKLGIKFHLINMKLSWPKAQKYCRENHTDLVSGHDQLEESKRSLNLTQSEAKLWIGLFRNNWTWSDGSNFSFRDWDLELFNDGKHERCAVLSETGKWGAAECDKEKPFFCYKDKMILINENKTWVEALYYCREKYNDLVSITDARQQKWVQEKAKKASSTHVWLGLRYTCTLDFWFWVTDEAVKYMNWDSDEQTDDCNMSGVMDRGGHHKWFKKPDNQSFNFICTV